MKMLQTKHTSDFLREDVSNDDVTDGKPVKAQYYAGRTIDLTLFAVARAADVIVGELWNQRKIRRTAEAKWSKAFTTLIPAKVDRRFANPVRSILSYLALRTLLSLLYPAPS